MKRRLLTLLALSVLFSLSFAMTRADEIPADSYAKYFPADTFAYFEMRDVPATVGRLSSTALIQMFNDPEIKMFIESLSEALGDEVGTFDLKSIEALFEKAQLAFKGSMCIAMPRVSQQDKTSRIIIIAEIKPDAAQAVTEFLEYIKGIVMPDEEELVVTDRVISETKVTVYKQNAEANDDESVCLAMTDKHAILTLGVDTMTVMLGNMAAPPKDSLTTYDKFVETYKAVRSPDAFFYYDMIQYYDLTAPAMQLLQTMPILEKYYNFFKDFILAQGVGMSFDDGKIIEEGHSLLNINERTKLTAMMSKHKTTCKTAEVMPRECMFYASIALPFADFAQEEGLLGDDVIPENFRAYENNMMLSFKEDILPALGNEVGIYVSMQFLMPEFLVAIEVKNEEVIKKALTGLDMLLGGSVSVTEFQEQTLYTYGAAAMPGMQFAASACNGYLFIGLIGAVKSAIVQKGKKLSENEKFNSYKSIMDGFDTSMFVYVDVPNIMGFAYDNLIPFVQAYLAQLPEFDPTTVPTRNTLLQHLTPYVCAYGFTSNAMRIKSSGFFSLTLLTMASVFAQGLQLMPQAPAIPVDNPPPDLF